MEEHLPQAIANSILECLPEPLKTESYVEGDRSGRYAMLLQRDGEGQVPIMNVFDNYTLLLYKGDDSQKFEYPIKQGLERKGCRIKWGPTRLGSSFLYLLEVNGTSTQ